jgi:hypothetical protein
MDWDLEDLIAQFGEDIDVDVLLIFWAETSRW